MIVLYTMGKVWIVATMMGGITFHLCEMIKEKGGMKAWHLLWIMPLVWWLPRGEESNIIYLRDSLACSIIIITLFGMPFLQKIWNWNKLKNIKKISYSLFITHGLLNNLLFYHLVSYLKEANAVQNIYVLEGILWGIVLLIDLVIAGIVYYLVENKLYKRINLLLESETANTELMEKKGN